MGLQPKHGKHTRDRSISVLTIIMTVKHIVTLKLVFYKPDFYIHYADFNKFDKYVKHWYFSVRHFNFQIQYI